MADNKDKQSEQEIKTPERPATADNRLPLESGPAMTSEKKENLSDDRIVSAELRREIEMMELDDKLKEEAQKKAEKIEFLGEKEKIGHLLDLARQRGVVFAIQVARRMNEPYLLDILHDTLAQEGFYKDFTK